MLEKIKPVLKRRFFKDFLVTFFALIVTFWGSVTKIGAMKLVAIFLLLLSASALGAPKASKCIENGKEYEDGEQIPNTDPCQDCFCFEGKMECAISSCGFPPPWLNCVELPSAEEQCCPDFDCPEEDTTDANYYDYYDESTRK